MKKVLLILIVSFSLFLLVSCRQIYDVMPVEFAEWDGNYIYMGNAKTKTTGEDYQKLVDEVSINDNIYKVNECLDYYFKNNMIYLILDVYCGDDSNNSINVLVKYNPENEDTTILFNEINYLSDETSAYPLDEIKTYYKPFEFVEFTEDIIILKVNKYYTYLETEKIDCDEEIISIDYEGNITGTGLKDNRIYSVLGNGYLVTGSYNSDYVYIKKDSQSDPIIILSNYDFYYPSLEYIKKDNEEGISFAYADGDKRYLAYYSFSTNNFAEPLEISPYSYFYNKNDYVFEYELKDYNFYGHGKYNKTLSFEVNNTLSKIIYSSEKVEKIQVYKFNDLVDSLNIDYINDEYMLFNYRKYHEIVFKKTIIRLGSNSDIIRNIYYFTNENLKEVDSEEYEDMVEDYTLSSNIHNVITYKNYQYFFYEDYIKEAVMSPEDPVYYFKRYDIENDKIETLQFITHYEGYDINYSKEMFDNLLYDFETIFEGEREYFIVLDH